MGLKVLFELCYLDNNYHCLFVRNTDEYDREIAIKRATQFITKFNNLKNYRVLKVTDEPVVFKKYSVKIEYLKPNETFRRTTFINTYAENPWQAERVVSHTVSDWPDGKKFKYQILQIAETS